MKYLIALFTLLICSSAHADSQRNPCFYNLQGGCQNVGTTSPLPTGQAQTNAYSASVTSQVIASGGATDVMCISGANGKLIKIQGIRISGTASANTVTDTLVVKRSALNTGGTAVSVTSVPHDSGEPAASATVTGYTANPTLGQAVGTLRSQSIVLAGSSSPNLTITPVTYQFSVYEGKVPTLNASREAICINLNNTSITGGGLDADIQWTEQ